MTGDETYGQDPTPRAELARRAIGHVLAVVKDHQIASKAGPRRTNDLADTLPDQAGNRVSAGPSAEGDRICDWALVATTDADLPGHHHPLVRRRIHAGEVAFYWTHSRRLVGLTALIRVADIRWTVEENIQSSKVLPGLDKHHLRRWTSWRPWTLLAVLAHTFLIATTAPAGRLIALALNEIRHLFIRLATSFIRLAASAPRHSMTTFWPSPGGDVAARHPPEQPLPPAGSSTTQKLITRIWLRY